ncbi:uncharacterized protein B0I36DRAFT_16859 [Microdochium trichocladiopsis]|uniref:Prolyl 4-hydroxylase alpha subunit domain-containing protein n=1 Tax=Microdochium trichocladiopsis TaxID=1682393 RepID=A0A9P8YJ22_9PEZI|nr:uncharacterized protein B0I36DRAFT_16859 [Microdochium trichocladiopsis]KAH7040928.1 hypothetical protein B0I36DRAFT_16859 [Microdochium trichocladiopsis]
MDPPRTIQTPRGTIVELALPEHEHEILESGTTQERINAISYQPIDFSQTDLPEYHPFFALVLDNVFSEEECAMIRALPEDHWAPLVQGNAFREVDRTLVLNTQVADVLYARIRPHLEKAGVTRLRKAGRHQAPASGANAAAGAEASTEPVRQISSPAQDWSEGIAGASNLKAGQGRHKATWDMYAANERLSFLRYGPGMHHDRHCDQVFSRPGTDKEDKSFLTCQVYLSDRPAAEAGTADAGGTTRFWGPPGSSFERRFVDVVPRAGRVLVFQQRMLWHSGQPVNAGLKYAMRTDLMYQRSFT